jgi:hypothetical protein
LTFLALIKKPGVGRRVVLFFAIPVAVAAYTIDVGDRLGWITLSEPNELIYSWGSLQQSGAPYMLVNSRLLLEYADSFKMLLVLNVPYSNIDKMTDACIEKSAMFTITGGVTTIAIKPQTPPNLRLPLSPDVKIGDEISVLTNFNLVILPSSLSADQIRSLSDVERLGGKTIIAYSTNLHFRITEEKEGTPSVRSERTNILCR